MLEMYGVHHTFVQNIRPEALATVANAPVVTTSDGRHYPARRAPASEPSSARELSLVPTGDPGRSASYAGKRRAGSI
jgi:hypothetical protein